MSKHHPKIVWIQFKKENFFEQIQWVIAEKYEGVRVTLDQLTTQRRGQKIMGVILGIGQLVTTANHGFKAVVKIIILSNIYVRQSFFILCAFY